MSRLTVIAAVAALAAAVPATAAADPPTKVTIIAVFNPITFGDNAYVNGQLQGTNEAGQPVALEQSPPPYTDWTPVGQVNSDAQGYYSFKLQPTQTMQYRTSSQGVPSTGQAEVDVAPKIQIKASPAGKATIRFSGTLGPTLTGQTVTIQRRNAFGSWATVTNIQLVGNTFQGRMTAHTVTTLRAFYAGDPAHLSAASNTVKVRPVQPKKKTKAKPRRH